MTPTGRSRFSEADIQIAQSGHDPEPAFMRTANGKVAAAWTVPFEHFTSAPRST
jgi:hypothetical protein